jgi:CDP-4-dehydro-6-deoxyglucose reductase
MPFKVTNRKSGTEFEVDEEHSILDAALLGGKVFPYSCRSGSCATCKATLVSGSVTYGDERPPAISDEEIRSGKVLLCQARPTSDVVIDATEIAAGAAVTIKTLPVRVTAMKRLCHDVMQLDLRLPQNQTLDYLAGQYIDILMRDGRRRSFSLANQPVPGSELQIHVRRVPGGRFTAHVFETMKVRDLLRFQGPFGTFFLRRESDRPAILMAGGTGLAPIKAIVEDAQARGDCRPLRLYWGVRATRDLYLDGLLRDWAGRLDHFDYVPVLSEPDTGDDWHGRTGWVHEAVLEDHPDLAPFDVYASGPPPMFEFAIDSVVP